MLCAATRGNALAANSLGNLFNFAQGVDEDAILACRWWGVAVRNGYAKAESRINTALKKIKRNGLDWRKLPYPDEMVAADQGKLQPLPE